MTMDLSNIRPGDEVLVRATVRDGEMTSEASVFVSISTNCHGYVSPNDIIQLLPRPLRAGDWVRKLDGRVYRITSTAIPSDMFPEGEYGLWSTKGGFTGCGRDIVESWERIDDPSDNALTNHTG